MGTHQHHQSKMTQKLRDSYVILEGSFTFFVKLIRRFCAFCSKRRINFTKRGDIREWLFLIILQV
jgi:hypothetical protein